MYKGRPFERLPLRRVWNMGMPFRLGMRSIDDGIFLYFISLYGFLPSCSLCFHLSVFAQKPIHMYSWRLGEMTRDLSKA